MGWHWVTHLAAHCQLYVITEKGFQQDIEKALPQLNLNFVPEFHYIDIGDKARELFWKQGSFSFYSHYKEWQKKACAVAEGLITTRKIDIIHQLNLIGFREPGYLWQLSHKVPYMWGPVGGYNQVPLNYIARFDIKNQMFYYAKHLINFMQVRFHPRVRKAFQNARKVLAESSTTKRILKKQYGIEAILMNETGADFNSFYSHPSFCNDNTLHVLWVGRMQGLKALPLALKVLKHVKNDVPIKMTVAGDGPDEVACKKMVEDYGLQNNVVFTGRIPNTEVKDLMKTQDLLFFTSLKEGTPHVILEALSNGLPVLCHDACGHGDIVESTCGIKIPMISFDQSVKQFAEKLRFLYKNQEKLLEFSKGAKESVLKHSWEHKAGEMVKIYSMVAPKKVAAVAN